MTKVLRRIGYWNGPAAPGGWPDVHDFVLADPNVVVQQSVAAYLRSGTIYVAAGGRSVCRLCGASNGSTEQTDGEHFVWPEGLAHYVEEHGVRLPDEVVAIAGRGTAPAVDPDHFVRALLDDELTIDADWWLGLAGSLEQADCGCARTPVSWDPLATADIYVDRVPLNSVAILVQLRQLLGATWPSSALRQLLASQPFLAVTAGRPFALHSALAQSVELRPYLFYGAEDGLKPVWPGS